jgi:predicted nuclease with TOPRIM domain
MEDNELIVEYQRLEKKINEGKEMVSRLEGELIQIEEQMKAQFSKLQDLGIEPVNLEKQIQDMEVSIKTELMQVSEKLNKGDSV